MPTWRNENADAKTRAKLLIACGVSTAGSGGVTIASSVEKVRDYFGPERLAGYEEFLYMAVAFSLFTGLLLFFFPKKIILLLTKYGVATSIMLLGFSLLGVFVPGYKIIWQVLLALVAVILAFVLGASIGEAKKHDGSDIWDVILTVLLLVVFLGIWILPLWLTW